MMRIGGLAGILVAVAALQACSDKVQNLDANSASKQDGAAYGGTGSQFVAPGWKQGDKGSWEQHLKARAQIGQNDYAKAN